MTESVATTKTGAMTPNEKVGIRDILPHLYATKEAMIAQTGLMIVVTRVVYALSQHEFIPFSIHPICNSLGLFLLAEAILLVQPQPKTPAHKAYMGEVHGLLNATAVALFMTAASAVVGNKIMYGGKHLATWHATLGAMIAMYVPLIAVVGASMFWFPTRVFGSIKTGKTMYKHHRMMGYMGITMIAANLILATYSDYNLNVLDISTGLTATGLGLYLYGVFAQIKLAKIKFW